MRQGFITYCLNTVELVLTILRVLIFVSLLITCWIFLVIISIFLFILATPIKIIQSISSWISRW